MKPVFLALAFLLLFLAHPAESQTVAIPEIHQRVTDLDNTLSNSEIASLESKLAGFEQETSNQIVVLIIPSLGGESLEDYSLSVAEKNKFGKKGRNNGVLIVIAKNEHLIRFEVGYGLEGALPDAICDQIIRHAMVPGFRRGDYFGGIDAGISAVILATKGEFHGSPDKSASRGIGAYAVIAFFLFFIVFGLIQRMFLGGRRFHVNSGGWRSSGPWFGGFGGGGFGGGGFGGGGFSGGGGSFGGGGASGSW